MFSSSFTKLSHEFTKERERGKKTHYFITMNRTYTNMSSEHTNDSANLTMYVFYRGKQWYGAFNCGFHKYLQSTKIVFVAEDCQQQNERTRHVKKKLLIFPLHQGICKRKGKLSSDVHEISF